MRCSRSTVVTDGRTPRVRTLLACLCLALTPLAPAVAQPAEDGWEILDERPADGEQCLVCRQLIYQGDIVEVRYKGRTFHVAAKMIEDFKADPDRYFRSMQAHGGLFDESAFETPDMDLGWLGFGVYILVGLVFGAICSYAALNRGLSGTTWFAAGLIGNVLAWGAFYLTQRGVARRDDRSRGLSKIPATRLPVDCPACGESNHPSASACGGCGEPLEPSIEPETARA